MTDYEFIRQWLGLFTEPDHNDPRNARNRWLRRQRVMAVRGMSPGEHAALFEAQREFAPEVSCFDRTVFVEIDETVKLSTH
jgi:hypothetical protein